MSDNPNGFPPRLPFPGNHGQRPQPAQDQSPFPGFPPQVPGQRSWETQPSQQNGYPLHQEYDNEGNPVQYPQQAQPQNPYEQPNSYTPQPQQFAGQQAPQQFDNGNDKKQLWKIVGIVAGVLVVLIVLLSVLVAATKGLRENDSAAVPGASIADPITGTPVASTDDPAKDQAFNERYEELEVKETFATADSARGLALETCVYLETNPTADEFAEELLDSNGDPYQIGKVVGAGMVVYCPSQEDHLFTLMGQQ
jgi:hypothetical protein